jgi:hypothetical protein
MRAGETSVGGHCKLIAGSDKKGASRWIPTEGGPSWPRSGLLRTRQFRVTTHRCWRPLSLCDARAIAAATSRVQRIIDHPTGGRSVTASTRITDAACHLPPRLASGRRFVQPTFREQPRQWVALDIEGIARPDTLPAADLLGCARLAIATLPAAFHDRQARATASSPTAGGELKRWLAGSSADPAVFSAVAHICAAPPLFMGGMADPLLHRGRAARVSVSR